MNKLSGPTSKIDPVDLYVISLIIEVKNHNSSDAFEKIVKYLNPQIKSLANKLFVPHMDYDDKYQECLWALRYKGIPSYRQDLGGPNQIIASPARFFMLCIKRHLLTKKLDSKQRKNIVLNSSCSLSLECGEGGEVFSLADITPGKYNLETDVQNREYFKLLMNALLPKLSQFEKQVFFHWARQMTDTQMGKKLGHTKKSIDNAVSRVKRKSLEAREEVDALSETILPLARAVG